MLASWLFLVLFGSVAAFTIYLRLLRDWGPVGAGMYAFVSPVIAVGLGGLVYGERFGLVEGLGTALLLGAAGLVLHGAGHPPVRPRCSASEGSPVTSRPA